MKKSTRIVQIFLLIFLVAPYLIQAQINSKTIESKVDSLLLDLNNKTVPGSVVLVVKDGAVLFNKGYGLANLEYSIPMNSKTVFDIASVSKQFTGFAISQLIEDGKISPSDKVRKYIPELPEFTNDITIEQLVYHTSGIRDWTGTLTMAGWNYDDVINFDQILRMAFNQKELNFESGSEFSYSNTGYNLLVEIVQRVSELSFREWTDQYIFQPLGMKNSFFLDDLTEVVPNKAYSYFQDKDGDFHVNLNNTIALGSSSLNTTTADLAKWVINLDNKKVGGKAVVERMFQTGKLKNGESIEYAYGFWVGKYHGRNWIDHTGGWESFRTYLTYFPEDHLSIVVLNNNDERATKTALEIANMFIPEKQKAQQPSSLKNDKPKKEVLLKSAILEKYVGTYKLGPAYYFHISKKGNQLFVQDTNEKIYPIKSLSKNSFWVEEYEENIDFEIDKSGKKYDLVYKGKIRPKVIGNSKELTERISDYIGEYVSDELKTSYIVTENNGNISLNHFRRGKIDLIPTWNDDFEAPKWLTKSIEFFRDTNGMIIGFKATEGGARNQKFYKK